MFQLFVAAMGPPGGGRNDVSGRFLRHLQVISVDEFDDATMTRIFTAIADWHFAHGFEPVFTQMGKVSPVFFYGQRNFPDVSRI